jgi:DME family drug/metabolite transporter
MSLAGVAVGNVVSLGTGPVFAAVLERLIERRRLSPLWVVCTSVAVLGVVLLALSGGADATSSIADSVLGIGLGVVAGFSYALYTYASSRAIGAGSSAQGAMGAMFGMGAVGLLPVLLAVGAPLVQSPATIAIAAYLALLPMFVAYVLFGIGMRNLRSTTATTITLLEPVVATILAVVVVGERLAPLGWIGLIVIVAGVTVLATARQPRQTLQSP